MSTDDKTLLTGLWHRIKRHPWWMSLILLGVLMIPLLQFAGGPGKLYRQFTALFAETDSAYRLTTRIRADQVSLRWNGLVNSWRHPARDVTFNTEMQLPLQLRNPGLRRAEIVAWRVLSKVGEQRISWEAVWTSHPFEAERLAPIEPQIQQARQRLAPLVVKAGGGEASITLDLVPLNHAAALGRGEYHNRLQARLADTEAWQDLLAFDFTIPEDFELSGRQVSRYQYWQKFPLNQPPEELR